MSNQDINYTREAFLQSWNLTFLIVAMLTALSLSVVFPWAQFLVDFILLAVLGGELMYLGIMPKDKRFQRAIRAIKAKELAKPKTEKERFQMLSKPNMKRYIQLRNVEKSIAENYKKLSTASQGLLDSHITKMDGLLDSYLNMLYSKERYALLQHESRETQIAEAMRDLRIDMEDDSPKVRSIKARRLKILEKRLNEFKRTQENEEIINAQLETIEDVIQYIHEQSLTMKNPEEITFQLDTLLNEVEATQASVIELEEVFNPQSGGLLDDVDAYGLEDSGSSQSTGRTQVNS